MHIHVSVYGISDLFVCNGKYPAVATTGIMCPHRRLTNNSSTRIYLPFCISYVPCRFSLVLSFRDSAGYRIFHTYYGLIQRTINFVRSGGDGTCPQICCQPAKAILSQSQRDSLDKRCTLTCWFGYNIKHFVKTIVVLSPKTLETAF